MDASGSQVKDVRLQWGEIPTSIGMDVVSGCKGRCSSFHPSPAALIGDSHVMGWGSKAIEIRAVENGQLDGVFMHKRTQKLRFLCERNDKVSCFVC